MGSITELLNFSSLIIAVVAPDLKYVNTASVAVVWYSCCPIYGGWIPAVVNTTEQLQVQSYLTDNGSAYLKKAVYI